MSKLKLEGGFTVIWSGQPVSGERGGKTILPLKTKSPVRYSRSYVVRLS